jgi:integrase
LKPRRDPYWHRLARGRYVGFRKMSTATTGTWLARCYLEESGASRYKTHPLGEFADLGDRERFDAAKRAAEEWFGFLDQGGAPGAPLDVKGACAAYVAHLKAERRSSAATDAQGRFKRLVDEDSIGRVPLIKLTARHVGEWATRILKRGGTVESFNRNATALRAALNLALENRDVASNHAWAKKLKPRDTESRRDNAETRVRGYLDAEQRATLYEKASPELRRYIRVLMLLPLRPGDAARLQVEHFDSRHGTLSIPAGKTSRRDIPLSADAIAHFKANAKSKLPSAWLITRDDGQQWTKEWWRDSIKEAVTAAELPTNTVAYTVRHSVITDLVVGGLDLFTVAQISGTSVEMIEKHYGKLRQRIARDALESLARVAPTEGGRR